MQYEQTIASQVQRLRSTTRAFQSITQRYTAAAMRKTQLNIGKSQMKQSQQLKDTIQDVFNLSEELKSPYKTQFVPLISKRRGKTHIDNLMKS